MKNDPNRRLLTRTECEHILNALNNIQYKLFAIVYIIAIYHYKATRYNSVYLSGYKHSSIHGYSCLSLREPLSKGNRVIILEHIRWVYKARRNR